MHLWQLFFLLDSFLVIFVVNPMRKGNGFWDLLISKVYQIFYSKLLDHLYFFLKINLV